MSQTAMALQVKKKSHKGRNRPSDFKEAYNHFLL